MSTNGSIDKKLAINALTRIRREWEDTVEREPLESVQCSVGLILFDIVVALNLDVSEQIVVLGEGLFSHICEPV